MTEDEDILTAEYALGLLDGAERDEARQRIADDANLTSRVDWWREHFEGLSADCHAEPSASLWSRIDATLPRNDNSAARAGRWRATAIAAMILVVALGISMVVRPVSSPVRPVTTSAQAPVLLASLVGHSGVAATIAYDRAAAQLTIVPGTLDTSQHDAELWIIPDGGTPQSLGTINPNQPTSKQAPSNSRELIARGATLAITPEPRSGSPTGKPTGPIVATGKIGGA
jgi:anti-sigma-K factor RskA